MPFTQKAEEFRKIIMAEKQVLEQSGRYHFNEREHKYYMDGVHVPSVTKVISTIPPDLLMNSAFIRKTQIGTDTHSICEHLLDAHMGWGLVPYPEFDSPYAAEEAEPYVDGFRKFLANEEYYYIASELRVHSHRQRVGGTMDILALNKKGHLAILDTKTASKMTPTYALQTAGYGYCTQETYGHLLPQKIKERGVIWLTGDNEYKMVYHTNKTDESIFLCKLISHQWDVANKVKY